MTTRDDVDRLIGQFPDAKLEYVGQVLSALLNPPSPPPEVQAAQERGREFKKQVEERFRQTRKPGTISGLAGGGGFGSDGGQRAFGATSFHYWDGEAVVYQTLRYFSGQEFEQMERLAISGDGTQLLYQQEVSSGGRTVRREEAFPYAGTTA